MAENYKTNSKSKSYRSNRGDETTRSKERRKFDDSKHSFESKTPPLPTNSNSIEELLKQRETLKDELKKIAKHSEGNFKSQNRSSKEINKRMNASISAYNVPSKRSHDYERKFIRKSTQIIKERSPEYNEDNLQLESEDEEDIIEQRRKQRKQLLEKFNTSEEKRCVDSDLKKEINEGNACEYNDTKNYAIDCVKPIIKEENDMFSEKEFISTNVPNDVSNGVSDNNTQLTDNWDDSEGYYNIREGDVINSSRYTIKGILGQGVFANVVRAQDNTQGNSVAIKIVRNNELIYKTGLKEVSILKEINDADPDNKYHCVKLMNYFMHKGHLCLVLESLHMDLRRVIQKYGKHHGLNMKALMSYSRQLLIALRLLKKIGIIHADIKPDNILINEKKNVLKLCDFGSAAKVDDNEPTPYLVSRFYRAPEIILGIAYEHGVDIWSTACTIFEMATGKILFTGSSNNKMLKCFMDLKGRISSRLIRKGKFKDQHFNYNNNFLLHKKDEFTGREKVVEISNINVTRDLYKDLKKYCKNISTGEEKKLIQLKDLLDKMIILDPSQRTSINDCLKHPFIQEEFQK